VLLLLLAFALVPLEEIRVVDGRAYKVRHSTNWHSISCTVTEAGTNIVFAREYRTRIEPVGLNRYRRVREYTGGLIALRNKSGDAGDDIENLAMRVGSTNYNGAVWKLYDIGTVVTNHLRTPKTATPANRKKPSP
jgi:hypothetical protein